MIKTKKTFNENQALILKKIHDIELKIKIKVISNANSGISKEQTILDISNLIKSQYPELKEYDDEIRYWSLKYCNRYYEKINRYVPMLIGTFLFVKLQENVPRNIKPKIKQINSVKNFQQISEALNDKDVYKYLNRGYPKIKNYIKEVKKAMKEICSMPLADIPIYDEQKKRIYYGRSLFAKAERKIRFQSHIDEIENMKNRGINNVWVSSHANCSERCSHWQGRAYTLDSQYRTINGINLIPIEKAINVYVTTKSGKQWRNGLFGFNCRHHIYSFEDYKEAPIEYTKTQMKRQRDIDKIQRSYERKLYELNRMQAIYRMSKDADLIDKSKSLIKEYRNVEKRYISFSSKNGVPIYPERYKTWLSP